MQKIVHSCCRRRLVLDAEIEHAIDEDADLDVQPGTTTTPSGPAAAAESFAWMNRQLTWQSILADLETIALLTDGD